jgi:hypothetical protein
LQGTDDLFAHAAHFCTLQNVREAFVCQANVPAEAVICRDHVANLYLHRSRRGKPDRNAPRRLVFQLSFCKYHKPVMMHEFNRAVAVQSSLGIYSPRRVANAGPNTNGSQFSLPTSQPIGSTANTPFSAKSFRDKTS